MGPDGKDEFKDGAMADTVAEILNLYRARNAYCRSPRNFAAYTGRKCMHQKGDVGSGILSESEVLRAIGAKKASQTAALVTAVRMNAKSYWAIDAAAEIICGSRAGLGGIKTQWLKICTLEFIALRDGDRLHLAICFRKEINERNPDEENQSSIIHISAGLGRNLQARPKTYPLKQRGSNLVSELLTGGWWWGVGILMCKIYKGR